MKYFSEKMMLTEQLEDFSKESIDDLGRQVWKDEQDRYHREDGPAIIFNNGASQYWMRHGLNHRIGAPAFFNPESEGWMINGKYHREDGPAFTTARGNIRSELYSLEGKQVSKEIVQALGKMK